jgi:hypothetical protein
MADAMAIVMSFIVGLLELDTRRTIRARGFIPLERMDLACSPFYCPALHGRRSLDSLAAIGR